MPLGHDKKQIATSADKILAERLETECKSVARYVRSLVISHTELIDEAIEKLKWRKLTMEDIADIAAAEQGIPKSMTITEASVIIINAIKMGRKVEVEK